MQRSEHVNGFEHKTRPDVMLFYLDVFQVNFLEELDRAEPGRLRGARKPSTTFKGTLLHIRYITALVKYSTYIHECHIKSCTNILLHSHTHTHTHTHTHSHTLKYTHTHTTLTHHTTHHTLRHTHHTHTHSHTHTHTLTLTHTHTHTSFSHTHTHTHTLSQHTHNTLTHSLTHTRPPHSHTLSHTQHTATHTHTLTHSLTHTPTHSHLSHTHTHTHTHTLTHSLSHTHTHTHNTHSHTLSHTHSHTHTHTHTHTTHTHTHTLMFGLVWTSLHKIYSDLNNHVCVVLCFSPSEELRFGAKESEKKCLIILNNVTRNPVAFKVRRQPITHAEEIIKSKKYSRTQRKSIFTSLLDCACQVLMHKPMKSLLFGPKFRYIFPPNFFHFLWIQFFGLGFVLINFFLD